MKTLIFMLGMSLMTGCTSIPTENWKFNQVGIASYYGAGEKLSSHTASGERFNPKDMTAAHRHLPFGTKLKVVNERTGKSVIVRINDRGPFNSKIIDLSYGASKVIEMKGSEKVSIYKLQK